ncbi:hypothetical protein [Hymenobacter weizhouensis]|uniref:hypothetical protein n=1 Tax=Hymenobacter sp. YIM 151500-1 TaxID=2987689 RepID=UPI002226935F|nr:hypothetical protein [Hymenobacter sp. YIM 151500-1]UYZ65060.1 hypothetical protein OIS53_09450 [Hymenobacter sp. YIM 151500-1]
MVLNYRLWQARPGTRRTFWLLGAAGLLLAVSVGLDVARHGSIRNWSTVAFLGVAALYALFRQQLTRYLLRRGFTAHQPIDYTLTATEIGLQSTQGQVRTPWARVARAVWVAPDWLLLFPQAPAGACYYLDLRRLEAPATAAAVEQLVSQHEVPQQRL